MIEAGLIAARFLHVAAAMALFGLALFPFYSLPSRTNAWPASARDAVDATRAPSDEDL